MDSPKRQPGYMQAAFRQWSRPELPRHRVQTPSFSSLLRRQRLGEVRSVAAFEAAIHQAVTQENWVSQLSQLRGTPLPNLALVDLLLKKGAGANQSRLGNGSLGVGKLSIQGV